MERVSLQFRRGTLSDSKFDKSTSTSTTASLNSTLDSRLSFHSFLEVLWISDGVLSLFCFSFALHTLLSALHNRGVSGFFEVIIIALADESMNTRADTNDIRTNGRMWRMSIDLSLLFLFTKPLSPFPLFSFPPPQFRVHVEGNVLLSQHEATRTCWFDDDDDDDDDYI